MSGSYEGERDAMGKKHGRGVCQYPDGFVYEGQFENDLRHGFGKWTHPDGNVFEGEWQRDQANGKGRFSLTNGERYEGCWKDNRKDGTFVYYFLNGDLLVGNYYGNMPVGTVKYVERAIHVPWVASGTSTKDHADATRAAALQLLPQRQPGSPTTSNSSELPSNWDVEEVLKWLASLNLSTYAQSFKDNNIDGGCLEVGLDDATLDALGITLPVHRRKLQLACIRLFSSDPQTNAAFSLPSPAPVPPPAAASFTAACPTPATTSSSASATNAQPSSPQATTFPATIDRV